MDGVDDKDYPRGALRVNRRASQKAALFQGSIRANMKRGRDDATDKDIWEALTIAQAKEIVEKKDGQLDFHLEQNGRNLSGGQRQRLTIAVPL